VTAILRTKEHFCAAKNLAQRVKNPAIGCLFVVLKSFGMVVSVKVSKPAQ
jgi:hypothetical protein